MFSPEEQTARVAVIFIVAVCSVSMPCIFKLLFHLFANVLDPAAFITSLVIGLKCMVHHVERMSLHWPKNKTRLSTLTWQCLIGKYDVTLPLIPSCDINGLCGKKKKKKTPCIGSRPQQHEWHARAIVVRPDTLIIKFLLCIPLIHHPSVTVKVLFISYNYKHALYDTGVAWVMKRQRNTVAYAYCHSPFWSRSWTKGPPESRCCTAESPWRCTSY